ncbi:MAG: NusG domain II-containing protein [Coriobacteriales bacterium]|nr:NusG domain II-containing protein [Coriobacteriales bacterium]
MRKPSITRRSLLVGAGILAASLVAQGCIMLFGALHKGRLALITDGDGTVREIPLDTNGRTEITTALGSNTIEVADGQIRVVDATCGNRDCVHQGAISSPGQTIVCLPNRLVIRVEGSEADGPNGNGGEGGGGGNNGGNGPNGSEPPPAVDVISG